MKAAERDFDDVELFEVVDAELFPSLTLAVFVEDDVESEMLNAEIFCVILTDSCVSLKIRDVGRACDCWLLAILS